MIKVLVLCLLLVFAATSHGGNVDYLLAKPWKASYAVNNKTVGRYRFKEIDQIECTDVAIGYNTYVGRRSLGQVVAARYGDNVHIRENAIMFCLFYDLTYVNKYKMVGDLSIDSDCLYNSGDEIFIDTVVVQRPH